MTFLRSTLFFFWFVLASVVIHILALPALVLPRAVTLWVADIWCAAVLWGLRIFAGLRIEIRGTIPPDGALVAAKHMSMLDTVVLFACLNQPRFVLKQELLRIPFWGWYVKNAGMIAIDREGRASALRKMALAVRAAITDDHAVVIFPEGTRKTPGAPTDYKPGVAGLYRQLSVACIPVALNSGLFWQGFTKRRGTMIVEFLAPIPPGLKRRDFMAELETRIETATAALVAESRAGANR